MATWIIVPVAASAAGCVGPAVLTQLVEARGLASSLHVQFSTAADAANRAVMADTDEASASAAREAEQATEAVQQDIDRLRPILESLEYSQEIRYLDDFKAGFAEYRALDRDILPLAVENTNLKAQRLSFGAAQEASDSFRDALEAASTMAGASKDIDRVKALAATARAALLEIQVIHARHIAEAGDAEMSRMETRMKAEEAAARRALASLGDAVPSAARPQVAAAGAALDRFMAINAEIVVLSRRNSNVRSLALSLGRKRTVTARCDELLVALADALAKHEFRATR
jgi:hypothetical protein